MQDTETITRLMPPQLMQARLLPSSYNAEAGTIEVSWGRGARVRRFDPWEGAFYDEELDMSPEAVDMSRLQSGNAPVLLNHDTSVDAQIGVIEAATIEGGEGRATIRLSQREDVAGIVADILGGIIRNVSVGYTVQAYQVEVGGDVPVYRAIRWTPYEISFVTVPADPSAAIRSHQTTQAGVPCVLTRAAPALNPKETTMTQIASAADAAHRAAAEADQSNTVTTTPTPDPAEALSRAAEIVELCRRHGMDDKAAEFIRAGRTIDQVRAMILDAKVSADVKSGGTFNRVQAGTDEADKFRGAAVDAILARAMVVNPATKSRYVVDGANPVRGLSMRELARHCLERTGVRTDGMSVLEMVGRAFTQSTSDFPVLLENAMHKSLQSGYAVAADTWRRFCAVGTVSDFRAHNRYRVGSLGNLDALSELGEFKNKAIPDGEKASITAGTKGNIINLSRQAIINDDLGAFIGAATMLGRAAARTVEADVYALLASNPVMADGFALFSNEHGNLDAAAAPTVTSVDAARVKMASQKDVSGNDYLDLRPAIFLCGLVYGSAARVLNSSQYDPDATNKLQRPNVIAGLFREVIDTPRIADTKWYLFADPAEAPVIEVAFLEGNDMPFLDQEEGFSVDGSRWKVRLDYGVAAIDYRGAVRNG
jgi:phage head maturation protease